MHMHLTIGLSLALMAISAGAMAKIQEKTATHHPGQPHGVKPQKSEQRIGTSQPVPECAAHRRSPRRYAAHHAPTRHRYGVSLPVADDGEGAPDPYLASAHGLGGREIGTAAWYNFVGRYTSSGERLDEVTATAAHRTLPLASFAKVTNLETGRWVIVKINDRGPWRRRFIIDLSPRAADELEMKRAGVASVMVEPVSPDAVAARPIIATFSGSGTPVM
jgi:rare lipoprotein A (peptidoglycan hydrolase)